MEKKQKNSSIYTITDQSLEPYYIQFDQYCYTAIKKIKAGNSERVRDQTLGYYSSLERCLDMIAEDSIKNQDYSSLEDFITNHKSRLQELKEIIARKLTVDEFLDILGYDLHDLVDVFEDQIEECSDEFTEACR